MSQIFAVVGLQTQESTISECYKDIPLYKICEGKYQPEIRAVVSRV